MDCSPTAPARHCRTVRRARGEDLEWYEAGDLPVERPQVQFVLNVKTVRDLHLIIPDTVCSVRTGSSNRIPEGNENAFSSLEPRVNLLLNTDAQQRRCACCWRAG